MLPNFDVRSLQFCRRSDRTIDSFTNTEKRIMPIVTEDQILALEASYDIDFPTHGKSTIECPDKIAPVLEKMGYCCVSIEYRNAQECFVFERDPWESQIVVRVGQYSNGYSDYCETGNCEPIN